MRTVCRFSGTEDAQRAARTIKEKIPDIYEIKMKYRSDSAENGEAENLVNIVKYDGSDGYSFGERVDNRTLYNADVPRGDINFREQSHECELSVLSEKNGADGVRKIMINCGGFDILRREEDGGIFF